MYAVKQNSTLVGLTELRANPDEVVKAARNGSVILQKRNHPIAAMISLEMLEVLEELLEYAEDQILGMEADERVKSAKKSDYIPFEKAKEMLGL